MEAVAVTYKVGDKTSTCSVEAKTLAESTKAKTIYVVDDQETECEMTARLNVARAKYKAALMAMAPVAATTPAK
jgi:predicted phosphoribosyltransferase